MNKIIIILSVLFIFHSCKSPKFLKEIEDLDKLKYSKRGQIYKTLNKLEKELEYTNYALFIKFYEPSINAQSDEYFYVYDLNNSKTYESTYTFTTNKINIVYKDSISEVDRKEINILLENNCEELINFNNKFDNGFSGPYKGTFYYLINLNDKTKNLKCMR